MNIEEKKGIISTISIRKIDSSLFDWQLWRAGNITDVFGIKCRTPDLLSRKKHFKNYAIGYCLGESLKCRPKHNTYAVMFYVNGIEFWTHFLEEEFINIWGDKDE